MREHPVNAQLQIEQKTTTNADSDKTKPNDEQYKKKDEPASKKTKPNDYQAGDSGNSWSWEEGRTTWNSSAWKDGGGSGSNWSGNGWKEGNQSQWNTGSWKSGGKGDS